MATAATTQSRKLFYPTNQKRDVLINLAKFEVLTIKDLAQLIFGNIEKPALASAVRTTKILDEDGLVTRIFFRPNEYKRGLLPFACGLSDDGVKWARENCVWTDPKTFSKDHSFHTIDHELKRAQFHIRLSKMCEKEGFQLFWRKTDLNHTVKPDDVFAIKKDGEITYYFFELENKRKSFKEMLEKYQRYEEYYGTQKCKDEWKDFKTFTVVTQIRTEEARQNILKFLAGEPVTEYRGGKGLTIVNETPIKRSNFWFSTEDEPLSFLSPKDYANLAYSFL